uniref:Uncharacterized protein n=1 Tax=Hemiselmis tepida TaxID=464990 RepID=A0A7S0W3N0_9CRYP|mmetsp:Transcript_38744/g.99019  ORF Transcript_38744/g.99019 Transcript_38744/m.99019 type:complete len:109 (+) Transcript_38744:38-364(+)
MAIGNWLPEWWWAFILLYTCEVSFVYIFDRIYNLKIGTPTYVALAGLAFVFAPAFFQDQEAQTTAGGAQHTTIAQAKYRMERRKEVKEAQARAAALKAKKEKLAAKQD